MMDTIKVKCVKGAPVENRKQGICMWNIGDTAVVPNDSFWRGMVDAGRVEVVEVVEVGEEPTPPVGYVKSQSKRGKK